jgi:hypothetical protein
LLGPGGGIIREGDTNMIVIAGTSSGIGLEIVSRLATLGGPIDALVNNAGFGVYGPFTETLLDTELQIPVRGGFSTWHTNKAYELSFSGAIANELAGTGVTLPRRDSGTVEQAGDADAAGDAAAIGRVACPRRSGAPPQRELTQRYVSAR